MELKNIDEPTINPASVDIDKMDKKSMTELAKKLENQMNVQKLRIGLLHNKIEEEEKGGQIAEIEGILAEISEYEQKIKSSENNTKHLRTTIDSQHRLLAKKGLKI